MSTKTTLSYGATQYALEPDEHGVAKPARVCAVFDFVEEGFGFGEIAIVVDAKGRTFIDGESMSRDCIKQILGRVVDDAILDSDERKVQHRLYDKTMQRKCGDKKCPSHKKKARKKK